MAQTEVRQPELRHRIAAAAGASVISALLVNPLDVVKTRVQAASIVTDRPLPSCLLSRAPARFPVRWSRPSALSECQAKLLAGCSGPASASAAVAASSSQRLPSTMSLSSAACACALPQRVADLGPDHLAAGGSRCANARPFRPATAWGVLRDIVGKEGVAALWRGTDTAMLASIPMVGVYMPLYDYLLERIRRHEAAAGGAAAAAAAAAGGGAAEAGAGSGASSSGGGYAPLLAGSVARTLAVLLVAPLELVRTRQQGSERGPRTAWAAVRETLRDTGAAAGGGGGRSAAAAAAAGASPSPPPLAAVDWAAALRAAPRLWTGVVATLARDVPFSAIYWGLVERIRGELLTRWGQRQQQSHGLQQQQHQHEQQHRPMGQSTSQAGRGSAVAAANLIAGSAAGAAAALVTTPFDVVKTQLQMGDVRGGGGAGAGASPGDGSNIAGGSRASGAEVARRILREEGLAGLFRGWAPRAARTAPACAVVVASYELLKMAL